MKSITFLRHAESAANAGLPTSDPFGIPLTEHGRHAAEAAAVNYEGPPPDLIVCSPYQRTHETAEPFRKLFADAAFEEWPIQELTYLSPANCGISTAEERRSKVEAYWSTATPETKDGPGAESFREFIERVRAALKNLRKSTDQTVLVVCHETFMKAAMLLEVNKLDLSVTDALRQFRNYCLSFTIPNLGTWNYPALPVAVGHTSPSDSDNADLFANNEVNPNDRRALDHLIRESLAYNTGGRIRELFAFIGKIPHYSPFNAMLLHIQRPDARLVLPVTKWRQLGRKIKPGAHPLVILATMGPVSFVFDEPDTEGDPLPDIPQQGNLFKNPFHASGDLPPLVWNRVLANCEKCGVKVIGGPGHLMKAGRITNRGIICNIELNPNHAPPDQFVTLAHELAHLFCGHIGKFKGLCEDRRSTCHDSAEIEAEATAYLVSQRYGIQSNSETYLSAYVKGAKFSLDAVLVAAGKIQGMCSNTFRPKKEKVPL